MHSTHLSNAEIENVSRSLRQLAGSPERCALLIIDVQEEFCNPKRRGNNETHKIAGQIAALAPAFREAGATLYAVYSRSAAKRNFYRFIPDEKQGDVIVPKDQNSAFKCMCSDIAKSFDQNGHTHILACGFNLAACVHVTVRDAIKGYDTTLLTDLSGNDSKVESEDINTELLYIQNMGCKLASAGDILAGEHVFPKHTRAKATMRAARDLFTLRF